MSHRGPDGMGMQQFGDCQFGANRLALIGTRNGDQPILNETRDLSLIFNGEIYNYNILRRELISRGHQFTTDTDGEVVLHLYEELGERCVQKLEGMFAFAIVSEKNLFIARDPLGIKPLYYWICKTGQRFAFSSEIKSLLRIDDIDVTLNMQAIIDTRLIRHAVGDETYFKGIKLLLPGHHLNISHEANYLTDMRVSRYSDGLPARAHTSIDEAVEHLECSLVDAVASHLHAHTKIGLTLSGGLDSTLIAMIAREVSAEQLTSFTIADSPDNTDLVQAHNVARMLEFNHTPIIIDFETYKEAVPHYLWTQEEPASLHGLPFHLLCRAISPSVKGCLHGEGADELFGGYQEYLHAQQYLSGFGERLKQLSQAGFLPSPQAFELLSNLVQCDTEGAYVEQLLRDNMAHQLERLHLLFVDRSSMSHSVEMRVPYLDNSVVNFVTGLPTNLLVRSDLGVGKYILRVLALRRYGTPMYDIVLREKHGFPRSGSSHYKSFTRWCETTLPSEYLEVHPFGKLFSNKLDLFLFDIFYELYFDRRHWFEDGLSVNEFAKSRSSALLGGQREALRSLLP